MWRECYDPFSDFLYIDAVEDKIHMRQYLDQDWDESIVIFRESIDSRRRMLLTFRPSKPYISETLPNISETLPKSWILV